MELRKSISGLGLLAVAACVCAAQPGLAEVRDLPSSPLLSKPTSKSVVPVIYNGNWDRHGGGAPPERAVRLPKARATTFDVAQADSGEVKNPPEHADDHGHEDAKKPAEESKGHDHKHETSGSKGEAEEKAHNHGSGDEEAPGNHGHDHGNEPKAEKRADQEKDGDHTHGNSKDDGHGHGGGGHDESVTLSADQRSEFGVTVEPVAGGPLPISIVRPAEVSFNLDRYAHVVPRVSGIVQSASVAQGHHVKKGQQLAVLESRELADAKAAYLAAVERQTLAKDNFDREKKLQAKNITSEKSLLEARTLHAEARIALRAAEQKLHALGISDQRLADVSAEPDMDFTLYTMHSPLDGIVVNRHLVLGEAVPTDREAFVIADLSDVWVDISIYPKDLPIIKPGLTVRIKTETGITAEGRIAHITPEVSEATRTAKARVVLKNDEMKFRSGMFVNAEIDVSSKDVAVRVPRGAIQTYEDGDVVFVFADGKFKPRPVKLGEKNGDFFEVLSGLKPGEQIAVEGAFVMKSQISKESFGDGHNH